MAEIGVSGEYGGTDTTGWGGAAVIVEDDTGVGGGDNEGDIFDPYKLLEHGTSFGLDIFAVVSGKEELAVEKNSLAAAFVLTKGFGVVGFTFSWISFGSYFSLMCSNLFESWSKILDLASKDFTISEGSFLEKIKWKID